MSLMLQTTLDAEIDEWLASLKGASPSGAIEPRGGKRGAEIADRLTERIAKLNKTIQQARDSGPVPFTGFTVS